ncbi:MAG: methyltransferase domain-containing protein [Acidobacteria bacterium]|nr:methyltransferase domain-containing protein [Acidobacteriota bacterium]
MSTELLIQEKDYLRQRLSPLVGDSDYLHLADLAMVLKKYETADPLVILDYGCGGSPYRSFFPNADYKRADFQEIDGVDYTIESDSKIGAEDEAFDIILSTQVAEHVEDSARYFDECFRLLRVGGRLICTTHGTYPDHGCPFDFQRWTADGLKRDLERSGFAVVEVYKLTTNTRALMYLIQRYSGWFESPSFLFNLFLRPLRVLFHRAPGVWQRVADRFFPGNRVVLSETPGHEFYLGLVACAVRHRDLNVDV